MTARQVLAQVLARVEAWCAKEKSDIRLEARASTLGVPPLLAGERYTEEMKRRAPAMAMLERLEAMLAAMKVEVEVKPKASGKKRGKPAATTEPDGTNQSGVFPAKESRGLRHA